eukprot:jgi/Chlat1/1533/Chrsp122S01809
MEGDEWVKPNYAVDLPSFAPYASLLRAPLPKENLFLHRGILARVLPADQLKRLKHNSSAFGRAIDSHTVVVRINQAPTKRYARHVGEKTTFRLINTRWTNKYADVHFVEEGLPLEQEVTLIVTRSTARAYDRLACYLAEARPDVRALFLSSRVIGAARRLLVAYRTKLDDVKRGPYFGGSTPSSGYAAVFTMFQLCRNVTIYGFGLNAGIEDDHTTTKDDNDKSNSNSGYHYFHLFTPAHNAKKNSMNPTHSFDAERDLMLALHREGHVRYCEYDRGDDRHNRQCGMQAGKPPSAKPKLTDDWS